MPPTTPPPPPAVSSAPSSTAAAAPVAPPPAASDAKLTTAQAVERFFTAPALQAAWFSPSFLAAVPFSSLASVRAQVTGPLGAYQRLEGSASPFEAVFEKGRLRVTASLDGEGRFVGLLLKPALTTPASMAEVLDGFRKLPGKVGVLILDGDATLGAIEPDLPLAVGSAFKLAALAALRGQIDAKKHAWRDVVELSPRTRSLPSGILQDWPDGAPLTLYALAALMISRSDNTATDAVIDVVGRAHVEPFAARNKPYLTTRELFVLKSRGNEALLDRFRKGDEAARRAVLDELKALPLPKAHDYPTEPTALDVEWFFTARELCALMTKVADLPFMSINPGVAEAGHWDRVAYKGGSEPGVLNTTTWLAKGKHRYLVATTWNAPTALPEQALFEADQRAFSYLATLP